MDPDKVVVSAEKERTDSKLPTLLKKCKQKKKKPAAYGVDFNQLEQYKI